MELILLGLVAGIGFASYALWSRARTGELPEGAPAGGAPARALPPAERTAGTLEVSDIVQHLGTDWLVEGVLSLSEDGRGSRLCALYDGQEARYLFSTGAEADPVLLKPAPALRIEGAPESLTVEGQRFGLTLRGTVAAKRHGTILPERKGDNRVSFVEYAAGAARLLLLRWGDETDAFLGERVPTHQLEFLPGR